MMGRALFSKYKKLSFEILPRFYRKIPKLIWGAAAAFGFFALGMVFAVYLTFQDQSIAYEDLEESKEDLLKLISGYEELSDLYYYQGQNVSVVTDLGMYETNPSEVAEAFSSADDYRDQILVQQGRIMELRKNAGLIETEGFPEIQ